MQCTWPELEKLADNLRFLRDQYLQDIPVKVFAILYRDLKLIEQEIRIFNEINNFLKQTYGDNTSVYKQHYEELLKVQVTVRLRDLTIEDFGDNIMSPALFDYITPFIKEGNT